jgi:uncharacterized protein (TIGR02145 family)
LISFSQVTGKLTDPRDGKVYKTVKIGTQTWMAKNLAHKTKTGCWVYDNNSINATKYGYLYDWETANTVCPKGWHLPSDAEWTTLINYLGGESDAGGEMKATTDWTYDAGGTNESGFNALPTGYRYSGGSFSSLGTYANFWSSSPEDSEFAWYRYLNLNLGHCYRSNSYRTDGFSVRCTKN